MPLSKLSKTVSFSTRSEFTKVDGTITIEVEGMELPALATLGGALEECEALVQKKITESYQTVPPRV